MNHKTVSVDVVVGGQAGSEGKGSITETLTRQKNYSGAIRCGGSNAGHTVYTRDNKEFVHQVLPVSGTVDPNIRLYVGAESFFTVDELLTEIHWLKNLFNESQKERIFIDPKAAIISEKHQNMEASNNLGEDIGSTKHGVGAARVQKIWRSSGDVQLAEEIDEISEYVSDTRVSKLLQEESYVVLEGTQGTLLSMNHSDHYPNTTSQDCIASSFLSSAGLPPSVVNDIWCVFRRYPIRVAGNSGTMQGSEISFKEIQDRAGYKSDLAEYTSVTGRKRRIFEWSMEEFNKAIMLNDPDKIALTFVDYINAEDKGKTEFDELSSISKTFIQSVEDKFGSKISILNTGPRPDETIIRE